ncbi:MAG: hypothetical protein ACK55S_15415, partial [Planctomycetota bacterium]
MKTKMVLSSLALCFALCCDAQAGGLLDNMFNRGCGCDGGVAPSTCCDSPAASSCGRGFHLHLDVSLSLPRLCNRGGWGGNACDNGCDTGSACGNGCGRGLLSGFGGFRGRLGGCDSGCDTGCDNGAGAGVGAGCGCNGGAAANACDTGCDSGCGAARGCNFFSGLRGRFGGRGFCGTGCDSGCDNG